MRAPAFNVFLPLLVLLPCWTLALRFPIEAHGLGNSIGTWRQLLLKGVTYFKLDMTYVVQSSCTQFSTYGTPGRGNSSDCFASGADKLCCLGFSGDTGSRPTLLDPFNTSYDFVSQLDADEFQPLYPKGSPTSPQLFFALDFGGPGACLTGCPGAALIRTFLTNALEVIQRRGLAVTFTLDSGISGWFSDLDTQCAGGSCSAEDKAIAAQPWLSLGGAGWVSPGPAFARYQMLNEDYTSFQSCCSRDCWENAVGPSSKYPWKWYEQTGQQDYLNMLSWWKACASLPPDRHSNPNEGLTMTSNQAPEMAEIYSAPSKLLGMGINEVVGGSSGMGEGSGPWVVSRRGLLLTLTQGGGSSHPLLSVLPFAVNVGELPPPPPSFAQSLANVTLPTPSPISAFTAAVVAGEEVSSDPPMSLLLAASEAGEVFVTGVTSQVGTLGGFTGCGGATGGVCSYSLQLPPQSTLQGLAGMCNAPLPTPLGLSPDDLSSSCFILALIATMPSSGNRTQGSSAHVALYPLGGKGASLPPLATSTLVNAFPVDKGGSVGVVWGGREGGGGWQGVVAYSSAATNAGWPSSGGGGGGGSGSRYDGNRAYIYLAAVNVSVGEGAAGALSLFPPPLPSGPPQRSGLGSSPRITTGRHTGLGVVYMTSTDGVCDCGLYTNNADMSHCLLPLPASDSNLFYSVFQTLPRALQYDFGRFEGWQSLIATGQHLGLCHRDVMHGKLERGVTGTTALFTTVGDNATGTGSVLSPMMLHAAPSPLDIAAPQWLLCGLPTTKEGLVWSSFNLVQPSGL